MNLSYPFVGSKVSDIVSAFIKLVLHMKFITIHCN